MGTNQIRADLDKFYMPNNSPITQGSLPPGVVPWEFGQHQRIQAKKIKQSQSNVKNLIGVSNLASGSIIYGASAHEYHALTITLSNNAPFYNKQTFPLPFVAAYTGTAAVGTNLIYPLTGINNTMTDWTIQADLDWNIFSTNNNISSYIVQIMHNVASAATVTLFTQWKYLIYDINAS